MKVFFLVPYPTEGASNRYRVEQYLPFLKEKGIKYAIRPFWNKSAYEILYKKGHFFKKASFFILSTLLRIFDILSIFRYDIVFMHREAYPIFGPFIESILFKLKKPFIFDFDDAIFLPSKSNPNNFIERFKKPTKVTKIVQMSKYVIAGNSFLAGFALEFNRHVQIIPTSIDTDKYRIVFKAPAKEIIVGWIGSATTLDFINALSDIFVKLTDQFSNLIFKIIGGNFYIKGLNNIISKPWSLDKEIAELRTFDIGIMPMPDNEWTRGKCGFKAVLYMSMGIPCVCSPVGVNKEIIEDGINGFLAETEDEWFKKLSLLIKNPQLRHEFGLSGRKTIEEKYSVKVNAPFFLDVLKKVYNENKY